MKLDERGKQCPLPVIETKKALEKSGAGEAVEVLVDNEIAVQNLKKLADHKGYGFRYEKKGEREFEAVIWVQEASGQEEENKAADAAGCRECDVAALDEGRIRKGMVAVISSRFMGQGDDDLGRLLMKGFVYALTQQDRLPETVLLYNGGAYLSCEGSDNLEDLKAMEEEGVTVLTCGTCLNHYGLEKKLEVGGVTNMYEIVQRMTEAFVLVRP